MPERKLDENFTKDRKIHGESNVCEQCECSSKTLNDLRI